MYAIFIERGFGEIDYTTIYALVSAADFDAEIEVLDRNGVNWDCRKI